MSNYHRGPVHYSSPVDIHEPQRPPRKQRTLGTLGNLPEADFVSFGSSLNNVLPGGKNSPQVKQVLFLSFFSYFTVLCAKLERRAYALAS